MIFTPLIKKLNEKQIPYAVVGGYALALHGIIRATVDVDLIIKMNKKNFEAIEAVLNSLGLKSRLPLKASEIAEFKDEYIAKRNLIAWSFVNFNQPTQVVDILLTDDVSDFQIETVKLGVVPVKVISLLDLKQMKLASGREQDLLDVKQIDLVLKGEN